MVVSPASFHLIIILISRSLGFRVNPMQEVSGIIINPIDFQILRGPNLFLLCNEGERMILFILKTKK